MTTRGYACGNTGGKHLVKEYRGKSSIMKTKPAGIVKYERFVQDITSSEGNRGKPLSRAECEGMDLITNIDVLKAAYDKVAKSSRMGTSYGKLPTVNDAYLSNLSWSLGSGAYQCSPSKRIYIPKTNGGERPLGIPSFQDKIVQQAVKAVIEPVFERQFVEHSHGFRPNKGTHTALKEIKNTFTSTK